MGSCKLTVSSPRAYSIRRAMYEANSAEIDYRIHQILELLLKSMDMCSNLTWLLDKVGYSKTSTQDPYVIQSSLSMFAIL